VDYFSICRNDDLMPARPEDRNLVILAAVRLGKTRLIDNLRFSK
ncbi:MAG: pantoate--beta-alanine ligase, partial [Methylococcaceae bacterium]|nr:pantoate--beta-alanine ligase [Methylococcaceae bacterium]